MYVSSGWRKNKSILFYSILKIDRLNSSLEAVGTAATAASAAATTKPAAAAAGIFIGGERSVVGGRALVVGVVPDLLIDVLAVTGVVQRGVDTDEEGGRHAVAEMFK